jgi:hypothetical protein
MGRSQRHKSCKPLKNSGYFPGDLSVLLFVEIKMENKPWLSTKATTKACFMGKFRQTIKNKFDKM